MRQETTSLALALAAGLLGLGCGPSIAPTVEPIEPPTAAVGVEFELTLRGSSPDGHVVFDYEAPDIPDLKRRKLPALITNYAGGMAVFRWIPLANDVGPHEIRFTATGNGETTTVPLALEVIAGADAPPIFRQPVGEGTTLNLARSMCVEINVVIDDGNNPDVAIDLAQPKVVNATIENTGKNTAVVQFCPSSEQIADSTVFVLTIVANDGNFKVYKTYTIVVRLPPAAECKTKAPVITAKQHGPSPTLGNLNILGNIQDDVMVASARVLWTMSLPADLSNPDLTTFAPISMVTRNGDPVTRSGDYKGIIPNPVVNKEPGEKVTIYYVLQAQDADPPEGCSHETVFPEKSVYSFEVRYP